MNATIPEGDVALIWLESGEVLLSGYDLHQFYGREDELSHLFALAVEVAGRSRWGIPAGTWGIAKTGWHVLVYCDPDPRAGLDLNQEEDFGDFHLKYVVRGPVSRLSTAIAWANPAPHLDINPQIIQMGPYIGRVLLRAITSVYAYTLNKTGWTVLWQKFYELALHDSLLGRSDYLKVNEVAYVNWLGHLGFQVLPPNPGDPVASVLYTRQWWELHRSR
jgi:hypothetical protein